MVWGAWSTEICSFIDSWLYKKWFPHLAVNMTHCEHFWLWKFAPSLFLQFLSPCYAPQNTNFFQISVMGATAICLLHHCTFAATVDAASNSTTHNQMQNQQYQGMFIVFIIAITTPITTPINYSLFVCFFVGWLVCVGLPTLYCWLYYVFFCLGFCT